MHGLKTNLGYIGYINSDINFVDEYSMNAPYESYISLFGCEGSNKLLIKEIE